MSIWQQVAFGSVFFAVTVASAIALLPFERLFPRIVLRHPLGRRVLAIGTIGLCGLAATLFMQLWGQQDFIAFILRFRLFSLSKLAIPDWLLIIAAFLLLDIASYVAHWLSHRISFLWRIHSVHHADEHVTAVSGLLHHPLENIFVAFFLLTFAVVVGIPVLLFFAYGLVSALHAALSHADVALPKKLDRLLRLAVVTPDVHRIHHSQNMREGNSNFGTLFTVWDRLFGTYVDQPKQSPEKLSMGLPPAERPASFGTAALLLHPFRSRPSTRA